MSDADRRIAGQIRGCTAGRWSTSRAEPIRTVNFDADGDPALECLPLQQKLCADLITRVTLRIFADACNRAPIHTICAMPRYRLHSSIRREGKEPKSRTSSRATEWHPNTMLPEAYHVEHISTDSLVAIGFSDQVGGI